MFATIHEFGEDVPKSVDYFRKQGMNVEMVLKKKGESNLKYRININLHVRELLDWKQDSNGRFTKRPKLFVFKQCKTFITLLPQLLEDEKEEGEINGYLEDGKKVIKIDHAYDGGKYGLTWFYQGASRFVSKTKRAAGKKVLWKTSRAQ